MKKKETWRKIFRVVAAIVLGIFMAILSLEKFVSAPVEEKIFRAIGIKNIYRFCFVVIIPFLVLIMVVRRWLGPIKKDEIDRNDDSNSDDDTKPREK